MKEEKSPSQESPPSADAATSDNDAACGPGCSCRKPSGDTRVKTAVCLIVLIAAFVIIGYKVTIAQQKPNGSAPGTFNALSTFSSPVENKAAVGQFLDSLTSLNTVAVSQDAVFIFVPGKGVVTASEETKNAINSASQALRSKGVKIGVYSLRSSSPDYARIAAQLSLPGLLVMTKGRGMAAVSGDISETKLLQAYVASSRGGGCCGASSSKCQ